MEDKPTQPAELRWPKKIFCLKNGEVIIRPVLKYVVSQKHLDAGIPGPTQAIPYLEPNEDFFFDNEGRIVVFDRLQN